ncbi:DNA repair protein RecN [Lampropedia puyangensis]|uniref:DNA repair protein RecN n=1 Tax=Lampropedia puyangensis TaxID=1330072 RepID=A0A4S8FII1_9BURK|nr:DNA repair protein RecN [Lampropedia puyangensis]THU05442.1 DNA repair protein RecN [Lampropedia puyangensis]
MALRRLVLRDFVLVQSLELDFQTGFTVLSGETGAGKSILVDAMQMALGARAESGLVREGAQRADIVAEFDLSDKAAPALHAWLQAHGFDVDETVILRRTVDSQGKSRAWINGTVATVGQLHTLGESLVDIHGQHAWQSLMRAQSVRELLDAYAQADDAQTQRAWRAWRDATEALQQAQSNAARLRQDRERLQWQIEEMGKLAPQEGEWEALNSQHTRLTHLQDLQRAASHAWTLLDGSEGEVGATQALNQAAQALAEHRAIEPQFADWESTLLQLLDQVADVARSLRDYAQSQEWDANDLQSLDARVSHWLTLARRHRQAPEALPALWAQWKVELKALDAGIDLEALSATEQKAKHELDHAAQVLSRQRHAVAPQLAAAVTEAMQELGMAGSAFSIAIKPLPEPQAHGIDEIEFLIASHAGGTQKPLGKVASGGELSRISLAIAVCTSRLGLTQTLVFDEVDTGIGGAVAHSVGALMHRLGRDRQVLAVTHLPQVAACADQHLLVQKNRSSEGVSSMVAPVLGEERVHEIARMLGSEAMTGATLAHAREMLLAGEFDRHSTMQVKAGRKTASNKRSKHA